MDAATVFGGWARYALPVSACAVTHVTAPAVGEEVPARVAGEVTVDLAKYAPHIRAEWDGLRAHDVLFLLTIRAPPQAESDVPPTAARGGGSGGAVAADADDFTFPSRVGLVHVRGCEVVDVLDDARRSVSATGEEAGGDGEEGGAVRKRTVPWRRILRVAYDPAQYAADLAAQAASGAEVPYTTFNAVLRRRPEENNFKAVLGCIRDVMNAVGVAAHRSVPPWLVDVLLGYGDPAGAHYTSFPPGARQVGGTPVRLRELDYVDTFLSAAHLRSCFPGRDVEFRHERTGEVVADADAHPPYRLRFVPPTAAADAGAASGEADAVLTTAYGGAVAGAAARRVAAERIVVVPYAPLAAGPFPEDVPRTNRVQFTPVQAEAIRCGMNPGLTLVVGPPGTGKTDTAVQIVSNLYHNFPDQRILLVTHSNQALNDLFEKIAERDIAEHHLLRLGAGEAELQAATSKDFSKYGRVAFALARRGDLLKQVAALATSLHVPGDVGYTCETAEYFRLYHVTARIEQFRAAFHLPVPPTDGIHGAGGAPTGVHSSHRAGGGGGAGGAPSVPPSSDADTDVDAEVAARAAARLAYLAAVERVTAGVEAAAVAAAFPFRAFFDTAPGGLAALFGGSPAGGAAAAAVRAAEACFAHLDGLFGELATYRAFELLRSGRARQDYMLTKQARVVAMTCTHAAIARAHLIELGFKYDTLVMEEAGQVLEVETFIPMVLQHLDEPEVAAGGRLKRVILIGDHNQLPPIIQNGALQKYARLEQSMFARLVRAGVPAVQLNAQGRARPHLAALYSWRYRGLGDLPRVMAGGGSEYAVANGGLLYTAQLVDVAGGGGEVCPTPYYYQNLEEAEFVVAAYQYMRLCGHPASRITLLTTYNGQKQLLRDIVRRRCAPYPAFGEPAAVETVDRYQGQQNDYVLLSLVRTRAVGHLRDVRRAVVALSRARLGLYVFARAALFTACLELAPALSQLTAAAPPALALVLGECAPTSRAADAFDPAAVLAASGGLWVPTYITGAAAMGAVVSQVYSAQSMVAAAEAAAATAAWTAAAAAAMGAGAVGGGADDDGGASAAAAVAEH